jgi:hypothetical protein
MVVTPIPILLSTPVIHLLPIPIGVVLLFDIHMKRPIFGLVELMIVAVMAVVVTLVLFTVVIVVMILGIKPGGNQEPDTKPHSNKYSVHLVFLAFQ